MYFIRNFNFLNMRQSAKEITDLAFDHASDVFRMSWHDDVDVEIESPPGTVRVPADCNLTQIFPYQSWAAKQLDSRCKVYDQEEARRQRDIFYLTHNGTINCRYCHSFGDIESQFHPGTCTNCGAPL